MQALMRKPTGHNLNAAHNFLNTLTQIDSEA